jgi:organic hydroperoxide reductase OsmC/OhrA
MNHREDQATEPLQKEADMTAPFPHHYEIKLSWPRQGGAELYAAAAPPITGGAPMEFDGRDTWWSPEHLLLSSLSLCLMTTFEAIAARARLAVLHYDCRAEATLERTAEGLGFTAVGLHVEVEVNPEDAERAPGLLANAKKHCIVANALKPLVTVDFTVRAPAVAGVA